MITRFARLAVLCALAVGLLPAFAAAQTTLGRLAGTVLDQSGAVLPGATITLTSQQTNDVQTTVSGDNGSFVFPQVPVGTYKVEISLASFKTQTFTNVVINVGQEYSLTAKLEIGGITDVVTVEAGQSLVRTTTPEVQSTIQQRQILDIPLANRDVTNLIKLQPGVQAFTNRANTVINGGRPTWTQVTLDGINIQDNFIRTNSLDFLPNRPNSDNVAEFTITSSVSGADAAGGATSVRMITPSGTNKFSGSVFNFNRNSKFAANSFFNNAAVPKVPKSELNRNQFGGRVGGPIQRDRLFFFANYEGMRQKTQATQNATIPLRADFFQGNFRYLSGGAVQTANLFALSGLKLDSALQSQVFSKIPTSDNVNNRDVGDSTTADLNTAGYRFNQTDFNNRDQYTFRFDYELSNKNRFEAGYSYFKEIDDRTDLDLFSLPRPLVYTFSDPKRFWGSWRMTASSNFQNELRGGGNLAPVAFNSDWDYSNPGILYGLQLGLRNPIGGNGAGAGFMPQGRFTDTYQLNDNASYLKGSHQVQFGGSWQRARVNPYNFAGQFPTVAFGFSTAAPASVQLSASQLPGISTTDLATANAMLAMLSGTISSVTQTFQVQSKTSGYVPGIPSDEKYTFDNIATFVQDNWRVKPNFTLRGGLKWEFYSPLREDSDLGFLPVLGGRPFADVMRDPNATITFVNGDYYKKDLNNFGPTAGFAWDVTRDGKTAVRGGYSLTFVNEETVTVGRSAARGNSGLSTTVALSQQYAQVANGVPLPATPTFLTERTLANQVGLSATSVFWGIDPNIEAPHVHQVSLGVQRELGWSTAAEVRYVGTFGRGIWRGVDFSPIQYSAEFLADFKRARQNSFLSEAAGLGTSPAFNAAVAGSQQLTLIPNFGVALTNATLVNNVRTSAVGSLVDQFIQQTGTAGATARAAFLPNAGIYSSQGIVNGAFSDYNSFQFELRRRFRNGFFGQLNYTWSDTKTDSAGTAQNRFEAFMDPNRPELSIGRSIFHITHVVQSNAIYELPFGSGRRWLKGGGPVDWVLGGWQLGAIASWQSGSPISILSGRGTFNRAGRSNCGDQIGCNTAVSTASVADIRKLLGVHKVGNKIYWIDPKVIDPVTGRGVGADNLTNAPGFAGQIFFNPGPGEVGNLPVMAFDGPASFRVDLALSKRFRFFDRYSFEFKGEAFNLTNTPSWFIGDMDINSANFGRITSVNIGARVMQLSARFDF
jgi:carboxypeptidase family protein